WVLGAAAAEALSLLPVARLQRWMFRAGGVTLGFWSTVWVTVAGNALGTSLPGGVAWSTAWMFHQYRRRGADRSLTVWTLVTAGLLSGVVLFVLLVVGLWTADGRGPLAFLRWPATGVAAGGLVAVLAAAVESGAFHLGCSRLASRADHRQTGLAPGGPPGLPGNLPFTYPVYQIYLLATGAPRAPTGGHTVPAIATSLRRRDNARRQGTATRQGADQWTRTLDRSFSRWGA
ncbi:MAG: lysylphosphatidylglycerol synthase domain-containing protein, partial [Acidimicrobiales bacterium]